MCTCLEPNASWQECGPSCADFCGRNETEFSEQSCPKVCKPGCFCAKGFIKASEDLNAPCIAVSECAIEGNPFEETLETDATSSWFQHIGSDNRCDYGRKPRRAVVIERH